MPKDIYYLLHRHAYFNGIAFFDHPIFSAKSRRNLGVIWVWKMIVIKNGEKRFSRSLVQILMLDFNKSGWLLQEHVNFINNPISIRKSSRHNHVKNIVIIIKIGVQRFSWSRSILLFFYIMLTFHTVHINYFILPNLLGPN